MKLGTKTSYQSHLKSFFSWNNSNKLEYETIFEYRLSLKNCRINAATRRQRWIAFRHYYERFGPLNYTEFRKAFFAAELEIPFPRQNSLPNYKCSPQEICRIIDDCASKGFLQAIRIEGMHHFFCKNPKLRITELSKLRWGDSETIDIPMDLEIKLKGICPESPWVFCRNNGERMTRVELYGVVSRAGKRVLGKKISTESLRPNSI